MYCKTCRKRETCVKICAKLQKHLKKDIEVSRRETLECELGINIEEVVEEIPYPEGEIELGILSWIYLIKNTKLTKLQRKYVYLYYWKRLSHSKIGKRYEVSKQSVTAALKRARGRVAISLLKGLPKT